MYSAQAASAAIKSENFVFLYSVVARASREQNCKSVIWFFLGYKHHKFIIRGLL
jgi:hypothetical protein